MLKGLKALTLHHKENCRAYGHLLSVFNSDFKDPIGLKDIPYLPIGLFKTHELVSVKKSAVFKVLTSSGTTGSKPSKVFLDRETARRQTLALVKIMTHILGHKRLPMIIIDTRNTISNPRMFSARGAGLVGMMNFGRKHFYALDDDMDLDVDGLHEFLTKYGDSPFLIFGFTFMVWKYFLERFNHRGPDLSNGILIHSGGWKKLQAEAVDNQHFKERFRKETGLKRIYNFYGMVEQVGSVFLEGEDGYLFPPNFAEIIIRDPQTWQEAPTGEPGVVQVLSLLPLSYPGHSILTEDMGVAHGIDDAPCGRLGKYFSIIGRVPRTELRGCSDTHAYGGDH
jgi:phenylacetate-coenzyme A ligase PaaK-like adenylate-forming protein